MEWSFLSFDPMLLSVHFYIYIPELYFIDLFQIYFFLSHSYVFLELVVNEEKAVIFNE